MNIFDRAAQILSNRGHCKHALEDQQGRVCAMGALNLADHDNANHDFIGDTIFRHVSNASTRAGKRVVEKGLWSDVIEHPDGWSAHLEPESVLVDWNNAPETTGEDVILLFKELAAEDD